MSIFAHRRIQVACPRCQSRFTVTGAQIMSGALVICPRSHRIRLNDQDGSFKRADRSITDAIGRFGR